MATILKCDVCGMTDPNAGVTYVDNEITLNLFPKRKGWVNPDDYVTAEVHLKIRRKNRAESTEHICRACIETFFITAIIAS